MATKKIKSKKCTIEMVFDACQAIGALAFFAVVSVAALANPEYADWVRIMVFVIFAAGFALMSFWLHCRYRQHTVLLFMMAAIVLSALFILMV